MELPSDHVSTENPLILELASLRESVSQHQVLLPIVTYVQPLTTIPAFQHVTHAISLQHHKAILEKIHALTEAKNQNKNNTFLRREVNLLRKHVDDPVRGDLQIGSHP